MTACRRIAMWSGPRNISTTMMRSFENRPDTAVVDEPLYAHFLAATGEQHPMAGAVLASQPQDWRAVAASLIGDAPAPIFFQKHMCHHITDEMSLDWLGSLDHFFLIRDPARMVASYAAKMDAVSLDALGLPQEMRLFEHVTALQGRPPPVLDAHDVLTDPKGVLSRLCAALDIPFSDHMLAWPKGARDSDGVWAPHWYGSVERSTGFRPPPADTPTLSQDHQAIVEEARPLYEALRQHCL